MDTKKLNEIRSIVIISLFSDDDLMDVFVLKGGNAISLVYGVDYRSSQDIDVSMEEDFKETELEVVLEKLKKALVKTFGDHGYSIFDVTLKPQPPRLDENKKDFWGGYRLEFKIIENKKYEKLKSNQQALRRQAVPLNPQHGKIFKVDISKYEYCEAKDSRDFGGHRIYVYTPVMVIYEKLRAICQQMDAYVQIVSSHKPRVRGRDFFDIYVINEEWRTPLNLYSLQNLMLLEKIFEAKRVPLELLSSIRCEKEFHRLGFQSLKDTVSRDFELKDFDFYFNYVAEMAENLKTALEHKVSNGY